VIITALEILRRLSISGLDTLLQKTDTGLIKSTVTLTVFSVISYIIYTGIGLGLLSQSLLDSLLHTGRSLNQQCTYIAKHLHRVIAAIILSVVLIATPLALSVATFALYFSTRNDSKTGVLLLSLLILGGIVGVVWTFFTSLRYALIPFVTLFEPQIPLKETPWRSRQLLAWGGKQSLTKTYAFALAVVLVTLVAIANIDFMLANRVIISVVYCLAMAGIWYLTVLYHHLRLVDQDPADTYL
jgi:hypothetical protein